MLSAADEADDFDFVVGVKDVSGPGIFDDEFGIDFDRHAFFADAELLNQLLQRRVVTRFGFF